MFIRIDSKREERMAEAWTVLTCARDLRDNETIIAARRVIDAYLNNRQPRFVDLQTIGKYFR